MKRLLLSILFLFLSQAVRCQIVRPITGITEVGGVAMYTTSTEGYPPLSSYKPFSVSGTSGNTGQVNVRVDSLKTAVAAHTTQIAGKEPVLGSPPANGYVLASTTGGVRSWIANGTGSGTGATGATGATGPAGPTGPTGPTGSALTNQATTFSQSIPFSALITTITSATVVGPLTFTPSLESAVAGNGATLRLVANGTNTPNFAAFKETVGSSGWDNRAGTLNLCVFYFDGVDYWFAVTQQAGQVVPDTTPPALVSGAVANATPALLTLTYSEPLSATAVPATSAYSVSGGASVTAVNVVGNAVNLSLSVPYTSTNAISVAYTRPATNELRDLAGNLAVSFSGYSATNNVVAAAAVAADVVFTGSAMVSTAGVWTSNLGGGGYGGLGASSQPFTGDARLITRLTGATGTNGIIALRTSPGAGSYTTFDVGYWILTDGGVWYDDGGVFGNTGATVVAGDRLSIVRSGSSFKIQKSTNNGVTWADIHTFSFTSAAAMNVLCDIRGDGSIANPQLD